MDRSQRFMTAALVVSALVHAVPIFGIKFVMPDPKTLFSNQPLDVVLVNQKTITAPAKAEALAQAQLDGGGNTDAANKRVKSPLPSQNKTPSTELEQVKAQQQQLEATAQTLMTRVKAEVALAQDQANKAQEKAKEGLDPEALKQQAREIAAQAAQISKQNDIYQSRPKKTFIGARTKEYRFAQYVEDWRGKVERYGMMLMPKDGHGQKLHGSLMMTVEIDANGNVVAAEITKSSGNPDLDAGAMRIAKMAAPYGRFPDDIRKDTDVLSISRTWYFGKAGMFDQD
ncbi:TonB family protein [Andreprevotia chitinilytica]|uniref:TonB family protein n=1 Tax=Andreprevotia chitinilytica TaxID=396808 RepID=UPI00068F493F|nr:TonB family protein [Andreprevotia chitinilytica]